ncbi:hypothetical protein ACHHYP_15234 [Achlya hypogyna]|uniref:Uncharacterized protein n=1 Tax=Achlya hypogyna TaxID=1202772 RepID=A0A1V9YB96_ACHHY|nr:hypothetical protein ACHHYP_15234 [Achlya hypogyna]
MDTTPAGRKFFIKKEKDSESDDAPPAPRQSKFDLPKDAKKRQSIPTNFYFIESSNSYSENHTLNQYKRKAESIKSEFGANKKTKSKDADKKMPTVDFTGVIRSNESVIRANEALSKEMRKATKAVNNAVEIFSTVWQQYQQLLERDIKLREQEMHLRHREAQARDDEHDDHGDVPHVSL